MSMDLDSMDLGPDWLTVTAAGYSHVERLRRQSDRFIHGMGKSMPWRWLGYVGRQFHSPEGKGGSAYGERNGGEYAVFQAWGSLASLCGTAIVCGECFWMPGDSMLSGWPARPSELPPPALPAEKTNRSGWEPGTSGRASRTAAS